MPNVKRKRPFVFTRTHGRRFLQMTELPTPRDEVPLARGVSVHRRPAIGRSVGWAGREGTRLWSGLVVRRFLFCRPRDIFVSNGPSRAVVSSAT